MSAMAYSRHAEKRFRQRGFRDQDSEVILHFGTPLDDMSVILLNKDAEREIALLKGQINTFERLRNCKAVVAGDTVVTCYNTTEKHRKAVLRRNRKGK